MTKLVFNSWTLVAALQSVLWFFGLPILLRPFWSSFWNNFTPFQAELLLNLSGFPIFTLYTLAMLPVYFGSYSFFEQYKISDKPWPWFSKNPEERNAFYELSRKSLGLFLFNYFILVPILTIVKITLMKAANVYSQISFADSEWPSYPTMLVQIVALTFIHEFGFYCTHRMMHHPSVYR